jgi:para-nitrobenzyl esterase
MVEYGKMWLSVIDHQFCVGDPFERMIKFQREMVPIMLGHTSSEFPTRPIAGTLEELEQMARQLFGEDAPTFLRLCRSDPNNLEHTLKQASVLMIEHAIRLVVHANSGHSSGGTPLYYYKFDAEIPGWDNPGTFHSVDLWFFFETLAKCWRPFVGKHYDLARHMCNYLCNFIATGNPNGADSTGEIMPHWAPCTADEPYGMLFADETQFVKENPSPLMEFLIGQYFKQ